MKVAVTGAGGQVGSEMLRLADDHLEVVAFDRRGLDITDAEQIERRFNECKPDLVVNCAAYTAVDRAEDEPALAHRVNAEAVGALGRTCTRRGIGMVHLSTDYVFDGTRGRCLHGGRRTEPPRCVRDHQARPGRPHFAKRPTGT